MGFINKLLEGTILILQTASRKLRQTRFGVYVIELDDGKIYRKPLYLMVETMVSCRFSLKPIHWICLPDLHEDYEANLVYWEIETIISSSGVKHEGIKHARSGPSVMFLGW